MIRNPIFISLARIPMFGKIWSESQRIKNRARIPKFWKMRSEFQCLQKRARIGVWKEEIRTKMFIKMGPEF